MASVKSYQELADLVKGRGGVEPIDMGELRDLEGAGKLGRYVRENISKSLAAHGLGHFPEDLPIYQHEFVRVYERNSQIGRVVGAVLHPSTKGDDTLRGLAGSDDRDLLEQVRKLVGA